MKRVLLEMKDLSSSSLPSAVPLFALLSFSNRDVSDSTISDIGGRNSFTGCPSPGHMHKHTKVG